MKPTRILDLDTAAMPENAIYIRVPEQPGASMSIIQYYIVCCVCDEIMKNTNADPSYYEAKEIKNLAPRLCIERDEAAQIAVAFSDDGESYCEMLALWASAGIHAVNTISAHLPQLLENAGIRRICVKIHQGSRYTQMCSNLHCMTVFQALYILFPGADIDEDASTGEITVCIDRRQGGAQ